MGEVRLERATVPLGTSIRIGNTVLQLRDEQTVAPARREGVAIPGLIAASPAMQLITADIQSVANASISVLIRGETGTGKEVVSSAIHRLSRRREGPYVVVDCGSMPATIIASELFGHEKGAFTGADRQHKGAFERADGGTLFLDEIGELPLQLQATLLGALERRRFRRVGGEREIEVDVRVLAATHRDLRAQVNQGEFRADLYYRLAVAKLEIPPLRERPSDIEALVRHFVNQVTGGEGAFPFGQATMEALRRHRWSGNVRELRNVVEAALALGRVSLEGSEAVSSSDSEGSGSLRGDALRPYKEARAELLDRFESSYLKDLMERFGGNASEAARQAKMNRPYLSGLLKKHGLR
jgi:DNA-binding NtrC family response regulator